MNRIRALNQSDSEHQLDTSISVLTEKTLEEIKHQYNKALEAKRNGQYDVAIDVFQHILQHDEIAPITVETTATREQFHVKYCCYKNLAEVHHTQASYRVALEMFLQAYTMDSTDVHFLSKFARLALEQQYTDLAGTVFNRCLELNSDHMPSMDGILEMLCRKEDYTEAYGWAIYCVNKCPKYQRAIDVICDVYRILNGSPLVQNAFSSSLNIHAIINKRSTKPSLFPQPNHFDDDDDDDGNGDVVMDLDGSKFNEFYLNATPSFSTFGQMIELIYAKSTQVTSYLTTKLSLSNICDINNVNVDSNNATTAATAAAMEKHRSKPMSHNFDESCAATASESLTETAAAAACNSQPIMLNTTSPIKAIFQEFLPQHFSNCTVDDNDFDVHVPSFIRAITQPNYLKNVKITTIMPSNETFYTDSAKYLHSFIDTLKDRHQFCMLDVMFEWLKWFSKCYHIQLPIELQTLYIHIFEYHCNHIDCGNWEGLSHTKICDLLAMELFYIELKIVSNVRDNTVAEHQLPRFFDHHLIQRLHNIFCKRALFIDDCDPILDVRLQLLRVQFAIQMEDFKMANDLLNHIHKFFTDATTTPNECIHLPNQMYCKVVDRWIIGSEMKLIKCLQQQQQHWHQWQWQQCTLDMLLTHRQCNFESKYLSSTQQYEMLVEWHWHAGRFNECLHWCEIGLNEIVQCEQNSMPAVFEKCLQHIRFYTIYLEHLVDENQYVLNSLNIKSKKRLIHSMAHLMDLQYGNHMTQIESTHKTVPTLPQPQPQPQPLFNATKFVNILNRILNSDRDCSNAIDTTQWAVLNIITKIAEWIIVNGITTWDDGEFLMCVWHTLLKSYNHSSSNNSSSSSSSDCCNSIGPEFNWTEIIRLLSHSIYGYPNNIERHCDGICTCKRVQIDWNGATLLFASLDNISNGMSRAEKKSLIKDLLNTIPDNLQMNLLEAISQLTNFLNDAIDFPHKHIPMRRAMPSTHTEIFYRIASIDGDDDVNNSSSNNNNDNMMANYGPYNREQVITMDLVINPKRYSSWLELLRIKISQFDKLYDAIDMTEINFVDVENAKNAIDTCFNKCQMFNRAETISTMTVDHLWYYGLYSYKLMNFFTKVNVGGGGSSSSGRSANGFVMRNDFRGIYTPKSLSWKTVSKLLNAYHKLCLTKCPSLFIDTQQKFRCYFMLGKMAEKQQPMAIKEALSYYCMAEQQLFDQQQDDDNNNNNNTDDTSLIQTKIEINFRITASIYKFVARYSVGRANNVNNNANAHTADDSIGAGAGTGANDDELLQQLIDVLQRNKSRLFTEDQLAKRRMELVDENANKVNGVEQQNKNRVNDIYKLCTDDFEWYLELWPIYYKAVYYLAKINMNIDDSKCRALLLQSAQRKANDAAEKKLSLFEVHRNRQLFKVKNPLQLDVIHNRASFNKYMEKCVELLIEYLATKPNPHLQFVLALKWCRLAQTAAAAPTVSATSKNVPPLNPQQINRLFEMILKRYIATASTYVRVISTKSKTIAEFFQSLYELYRAGEMQLRQSTLFPSYSELMITSYHSYIKFESSDGGSTSSTATVAPATTTATTNSSNQNNVEFQKALDFGAKKMNEKLQLQTDNKNAKKSTTNKNTQQKNPIEQ